MCHECRLFQTHFQARAMSPRLLASVPNSSQQSELDASDVTHSTDQPADTMTLKAFTCFRDHVKAHHGPFPKLAWQYLAQKHWHWWPSASINTMKASLWSVILYCISKRRPACRTHVRKLAVFIISLHIRNCCHIDAGLVEPITVSKPCPSQPKRGIELMRDFIAFLITKATRSHR